MYVDKLIGIYKIINLKNNNFYIGSSNNIQKRFTTHWNSLKNNKHSNGYLQRAWNKYDGSNFGLEILEFCNDDELLIREQFYIDTLKPQYNIARDTIRPLLGLNRSQETKDKISQANKGIIQTDEKIQRIKETVTIKQGKKVLQYDDSLNLINEFESIKEASRILNIDDSNIAKACKGKTAKCGGFFWKYAI